MSQMVGGLDGSLIIDQLDYSKAYAQKSVAPSNGQAMFNAVLSTALKAGVGNVAEWGSQQLGTLFKSEPAGNGFTSGGFTLGTTERSKVTSGKSQFSFNTTKLGGI
jgi:hypothetical protein